MKETEVIHPFFDNGHNLQGLSILVAMVLRSMGQNKVYDSDDEYTPARLPLIKDGVQPAPYVVDGQQDFASKNISSWTVGFCS